MPTLATIGFGWGILLTLAIWGTAGALIWSRLSAASREALVDWVVGIFPNVFVASMAVLAVVLVFLGIFAALLQALA